MVFINYYFFEIFILFVKEDKILITLGNIYFLNYQWKNSSFLCLKNYFGFFIYFFYKRIKLNFKNSFILIKEN